MLGSPSLPNENSVAYGRPEVPLAGRIAGAGAGAEVSWGPSLIAHRILLNIMSNSPVTQPRALSRPGVELIRMGTCPL